MTLTRSFKETVMARIDRDAEFRDALLREGIECLLWERASRLTPDPAKASDTAASPLNACLFHDTR